MLKRVVCVLDGNLSRCIENITSKLDSILHHNNEIPAIYGDQQKPVTKSTVITIKDSRLIVYINGVIALIILMRTNISSMLVYTNIAIEDARDPGIYLFNRYLEIKVSIKDDAFIVKIEPSVVYKRLQFAIVCSQIRTISPPPINKIGLVLSAIKNPDSKHGKGYLLLNYILPFLKKNM